MWLQGKREAKLPKSGLATQAVKWTVTKLCEAPLDIGRLPAQTEPEEIQAAQGTGKGNGPTGGFRIQA
jgi:hypothetical protein